MVSYGVWLNRERARKRGVLLTVLNYSGGTQSECLAWMLLNGDIAMPKNLAVICADPGMENVKSYVHTRRMGKRFRDRGITFEIVQGRNLYRDLLNLDKLPRISQPPYWVRKEDGSLGKLIQACTSEYKLAPMARAVRSILRSQYGVKSPWAGSVESWIGFSADEDRRCSDPRVKYVTFRYPLIEMGMTKTDVVEYFRSRSLELPPRSLCNACFAHGLKSLRNMHDNEPENWAQAVAVDNAVRHGLGRYGVENPVFVSNTLIPLEELAARNFDLGDAVENDVHACDSGVCVT